MTTLFNTSYVRSANNSNLFYRHAELDARAVADDDRERDLIFSSEEPVERWFGSEILLHGSNNVDLSRIRAVGSLIYGHNPYDIKNILGPVQKVWIAPDRLGRARVRFDEDESGNLALSKVKSGSLRGVSFGYMIEQARRLEEKEVWTDPDTDVAYEGPALIATRWTPYEITLTPIPADATVGIGREVTRSLDGIHITSTQPTKETIMNREEIQAMIREAISGLNVPSADDLVQRVSQTIADQNRPKYGCPIEDFQDLFGRAAAISPEAQTEMAAMLARGETSAAMQKRLFDLAVPKSDARDQGNGPGAEGTGMQTPDANGQQAVIRSFKQITDDEFFAGITNPAAFAVN